MINIPLKEEFLLNLQTNNYSPETVYNYERDLSVFEDFLNSKIKKDFKKITKRDLLLYKA